MSYLVSRDDGWRLPDWLWERIVGLSPAGPFHPSGCHRRRVPDRDAMDAILLVLRTRMQWNALKATGVCSSSSAHRRFAGRQHRGQSRKGRFPALIPGRTCVAAPSRGEAEGDIANRGGGSPLRPPRSCKRRAASELDENQRSRRAMRTAVSPQRYARR
jgi:Putative transposase of IS4/5 family (DUF4096)